MKEQLSVKAAQQQILATVHTIGIENPLLKKALGHILAETIRAPFDLPRFSQSAMDGFVVRYQDIAKASSTHPSPLQIVGTISAGHPPYFKLRQGETAAIMTGAPLPLGGDTVIKVEDVKQQGNTLIITEAPKKGSHIRKQGEIIRKGKLLLEKGKKLSAAALGLLATFNIERVKVFQKPTVAVLSTGDELVPLGGTLPKGKIVDSNRQMILAVLEASGFSPLDAGVVKDKKGAIQKALTKLSLRADAIITIGGISMGKYDFVKAALATLGKIHFAKVRMKPGGPQTFGVINNTPVFALPGNPVSALLVFLLFVAPALKKMSGIRHHTLHWQEAILTKPLRTTPHKIRFEPIHLTHKNGQYFVHPIPSAGSHDLLPLLTADGLVEIPTSPRSPLLPSGTQLRFLLSPTL